MTHELDDPRAFADGRADPASLTLSGLRDSVRNINPDQDDSVLDMHAKAVMKNQHLLDDIRTELLAKVRERRSQRDKERATV